MSGKQVSSFWRTLWTAAISILSAMAFSADFTGHGIKQILGMNGVSGLLMSCAFFAFYTFMRVRMPETGRGTHFTNVVCAFLFAAIMLIGKAIVIQYTLKPLYSSYANLIGSAVVLSGCFLFFEHLFAFAYARLSINPGNARDSGFLSRLFPDTPSTARFAAIILICWLPYVVANFPGGLTGDMPDQVGQFFGHNTYTASLSPAIDPNVYLNTMNPVAHTVLLGFLCKILMRGNDITLGIFAFCALQTVAFALVCARSIETMRRCGLSRGVRLGALAFYSLNPLIPLFSFSTVKDTAFSLLLLLVTLLLVEGVPRSGKDA